MSEKHCVGGSTPSWSAENIFPGTLLKISIPDVVVSFVHKGPCVYSSMGDLILILGTLEQTEPLNQWSVLRFMGLFRGRVLRLLLCRHEFEILSHGP